MSNTNNDGWPAFAQDLQGRRGDDPSLQGLSKRELFAALAMQGLLSSDLHGDGSMLDHAETAVTAADALLAALSRHDAALLAPSPPAQKEPEWRFFVEASRMYWHRVRATGTDELWTNTGWVPSDDPGTLANLLRYGWREVTLDQLPAAARAAHAAEQAGQDQAPTVYDVIRAENPEAMHWADRTVALEAELADAVALLRLALMAFKVTQRVESYPPNDWAPRAAALLSRHAAALLAPPAERAGEDSL